MLLDLATAPPAEQVGSKAARLGWLMARGWPVPPGLVAPFDATAALAASGSAPDADSAVSALRAALESCLDPARSYVVRSSADVEDGRGRSFAGQFRSVLGVTGCDDVLTAMRAVATSARTEQVVAYARRAGVDPGELRMAVIVQEMVPAVAAGVAFSRHPVTGADEVVVEAQPGQAERLVAGEGSPQRWVAPRDGTLDQPDTPVVATDVVTQVVDATRGIEAASGNPVDVEWAWDGSSLHIVQWRPISGLPATPRRWSSRMARDMLPGLIPPLVWSLNVPVLTAVWVELVDEALGPTGLQPDRLVRSFGYRAYFDMGAFGSVFASVGLPPDLLERLRGTGDVAMRPRVGAVLRRAPHLVRFGFGLRRFEQRTAPELAALERARADLAATAPEVLPDDELLHRIDQVRVLFRRASRLNIIAPLLCDAWGGFVRRLAVAQGLDPGSVDPGQELPAVRDLDPAHVLAGVDPDDPAGWAAFLARFGHVSDSPNDCSRPTWAEAPEATRRLLLPTVARATDGGRGVARAAGREALLRAAPGWQRPLLDRAWTRAAALRLARERVGYGYARIYSLFRPTFLELGRRLADRGALAAADDVFLLTVDEVRAALAGELPDAADRAAERRAEMAEAAGLTWPETILGDDPVPVRGRAGATRLRGVPTAGGRFVGTARVVTSSTAIADAADLSADDVLVLPSADVAWTPLLLRAGAVVTESGGMLSHASIVARELGLPCVASVPGATDIPPGARVCVDGAAGEVLLLDRPADQPPGGSVSP